MSKLTAEVRSDQLMYARQGEWSSTFKMDRLKLRDLIAAEIRAAEQAARAEALREAAAIPEGYAHYAASSPLPEYGGFKDPLKLVDQAKRIAASIRALGEK
jgi:hypothetical protein